ncbi:MAG: RNA polymerase Rpb4 family protein [Methanosarcinaceae archaeon]|nr:RNA polymerase Rpb4 family protein [Methanosarcinaceae archaeon]
MIVKEIISEEILTISEVKELLIDIIEERNKAGEVISYMLQRSFNHVNIFAKTGAKNSRDLVEKLITLKKMKLEIAIKIADIIPQSKDELRTLYAKERYTLTEQELNNILDIVAEYID